MKRRSAMRPLCMVTLGPGVADRVRLDAPLTESGVLKGVGNAARSASGLKRAGGNALGDMLLGTPL